MHSSTPLSAIKDSKFLPRSAGCLLLFFTILLTPLQAFATCATSGSKYNDLTVKTNLQLWLDADDPTCDGSTQWSNNQVLDATTYIWKDKSGNARDVDTVGDSPTFQSTANNGKPTVTFNDNDYVRGDHTLNLDGTTAHFTISLVMHSRDDTGFKGILTLAETTGNSYLNPKAFHFTTGNTLGNQKIFNGNRTKSINFEG